MHSTAASTAGVPRKRIGTAPIIAARAGVHKRGAMLAAAAKIGKKERVGALEDKLTEPRTRTRVVRACADLVEAEAATKTGFSGTAIRAGLKVLQAIRPGAVAQIVDRLLPEFAGALESIHHEALELAGAGGLPAQRVFTTYMVDHADRAAEALLEVTDRRVNRSDNRPVRAAYSRLRGSAVEHVRAAIPNLARTISPFV